MKLRHSNETLHEQTLAAAQNEKSATLALLERLAEVDACRLYALMGYSSLWEYVHHALHYSEAQASERVNSMRLMVRIPDVKKELELGNLSLTTTSKLASHVRREKNNAAKTLDLLKAVAGKSSREVEKILCAEATTPARPDQIRCITPKTTRITLDVDQDFLDLMERVKELGGHPGSGPQELFKIAMKDFVKRKEVKSASSVKAKDLNPTAIKKPTQKDESDSLRAPEVMEEKLSNSPKSTRSGTNSLHSHAKATPSGMQSSRYIPTSIKTKIRIRSGDQCEYKSPDGRRCSSRIALQFDHIQPFAKGGQTSLDNLRHYCSTHNRLAAIQEFGKEKMREHLKH